MTADTSAARRLSDLVGATMTRTDGTTVGRVIDLEVEYDPDLPVVRRWVLRDRRRTFAVTADVRAIARKRISADHVAASPAEPGGADLPRTILLVRDVLDCQVFDLAGKRLARASDVLLHVDRDGAVTVSSVDLGGGSIIRRFGLRRIADRLEEDLVDWPDLHLVSEGGHQAQLATRSTAIHRLSADDLVALVEPLPSKRAADILLAAPRHRASHVLRTTHPRDAERIIDSMPADVAELVVDRRPLPEPGTPPPTTRSTTRPRRRFLRHRPHLLRRHRGVHGNDESSS